ncbi:MAG: hypothetical protein OQJ97_07610 [Rhodospirillales bacterium]|nr:hypothetical protein [Rhodospirillales bacterium]
MLDSLYLSGWGAFGMTIFMFIPFFVVFMYVVVKKSFSDPNPTTGDGNYAKAEWLWLGFVTIVFVGVNIASIGYMPTVATAKAVASGEKITEVNFTAESWSFDIPEVTIEVGKPIRFSGKSNDTVHGFAIYDPHGDILFTMMLMPGMESPTSLIHTFTEPGTYLVRCLEFCGLAHHEMRDEIVVVGSKG